MLEIARLVAEKVDEVEKLAAAIDARKHLRELLFQPQQLRQLHLRRNCAADRLEPLVV